MNTIVAVATPSGRSAIGVIRLSGPDSLDVVKRLIDEDQFAPEPGRATLKSLREPEEKQVLDRVLVTYFKGPHSFTGEDVVELSCHGSPVILRQVVDIILSLDVRLAGPGEFTLRALSNGKLNLNQAEAIRDLIDARTTASARQAVRQLGGELSARLEPIKDRLLQIIVVLESSLEFVEDDLPQLRKRELKEEAVKIADEVGELAATFSIGHLLREGLKVTIVGRPNVGKSSLFNTLLTWDRAIVTEVAGTTRDSLTEPMTVNGVPILLTDTAGVREAPDRIESIGVERTRRAIADADLLLVVLDGSAGLSPEDLTVLSCSQNVRRIVALNKSDVASFDSSLASKAVDESNVVEISALTGSGIDKLRAAILEPFSSGEPESSGLLITDARHYDLLCRATAEINSSVRLLDENVGEELVLMGLHNALRFIGEITGETTPEEILTRIFSTFCIGK